jgi:hypothetical protein
MARKKTGNPDKKTIVFRLSTSLEDMYVSRTTKVIDHADKAEKNHVSYRLQ